MRRKLDLWEFIHKNQKKKKYHNNEGKDQNKKFLSSYRMQKALYLKAASKLVTFLKTELSLNYESYLGFNGYFNCAIFSLRFLIIKNTKTSIAS